MADATLEPDPSFENERDPGALPPWVGKLAALLLLLGLVSLVVLLLVLPAMDEYRRISDGLKDNKALATRLLSAGDRREVLARHIADIESDMRAGGAYLEGASETLAGAGLRERLQAILERHGGQLQSSQTLPLSGGEGVRKVTLRVALTLPIESLFGILYDIESGTPYLFVDHLDIKARVRRRRRQQDQAQVLPLTVRFDLYGYLLPEHGS